MREIDAATVIAFAPQMYRRRRPALVFTSMIYDRYGRIMMSLGLMENCGRVAVKVRIEFRPSPLSSSSQQMNTILDHRIAIGVAPSPDRNRLSLPQERSN